MQIETIYTLKNYLYILTSGFLSQVFPLSRVLDMRRF